MDRNTFTGLFLILIIVIGSTYLLRPSEIEIKREKLVQDSIARAKTGKGPVAAETETANTPKVPVVDSTALKGPFGSSRIGNDKIVTLENEHLKVNISSKGGRIESVQLKSVDNKPVQTFDKKPVVMFDGPDNKFGLVFNAGGTNISTNNLYFTPSDTSISVSKQDSSTLTMRLNYADGKYIDYVYSLKSDSYKVGFTIIAKGMQDVIAAGQKNIVLNWETVLNQKEKDITSERRYSTAYYKEVGEAVSLLDRNKDDKKELAEKKVQWFSFKQHFFSNALISKKGFEKGTLTVTTSKDSSIVKSFTANMQLAVSRQDIASYPMEFYFGPNKFSILTDQGYDLERQIDLGWGPLKWINRYVVIPVFNMLEGTNWNYGIIILILTILLKVVLSPLTYKSYLSMAKMRVLKPEMDEIKGKVGEDNPTLLQQEYLKLYKKAGVNPLGGCIPILMQLPIIMAFFFFFPNLFELRGQSFLWMDDLSTYDAFFKFGFTLPWIGNHLSLMCLLMTASQLIATHFNNQATGAVGQMKYIGYITPVIFLGVLNSYPAGLNYYYFLANLMTFGQQYFIRLMVNDEKIHAQIQENKKKPASQKKSKFQQRMDDYMRNKQLPAKPEPKPAKKVK
jgi:YidC/Oxa1 family membrane protein insertase